MTLSGEAAVDAWLAALPQRLADAIAQAGASAGSAGTVRGHLAAAKRARRRSMPHRRRFAVARRAYHPGAAHEPDAGAIADRIEAAVAAALAP